MIRFPDDYGANRFHSSYIYIYQQTEFSVYIKSACMSNNKFVPGKPDCICNLRAASKSIFNRCIFTDSFFFRSFYENVRVIGIKRFVADPCNKSQKIDSNTPQLSCMKNPGSNYIRSEYQFIEAALLSVWQ